MRMVGGSLLIVYETEWGRAEEGVSVVEERKGKGVSDFDEEDEDDGEDGDEDEEEEEEDDEDEEEDAEPTPYVVKLIDFAHTRLKPGQGPDEGVLRGLGTVLRLLDGRIKEVEEEGNGEGG
jgi:inositol-polyphosphate multikinase